MNTISPIKVLSAHQLRLSDSLCLQNQIKTERPKCAQTNKLGLLGLSNRLKSGLAMLRTLIYCSAVVPLRIILDKRRFYTVRQVVVLTIPLLILSSCGSPSDLSGAGATFPAPYYNLLFRSYTLETGYNVMYGAIGSGGGIRSLRDQTVDFGATDVFLSDKELASFSAEVIHIPTAMGAIVMSYNLEGVDTLRLTADLISKIYRGEITMWNDPRIVELNGEEILPDRSIVVVYRSDGSGTTAVFSDYMSKVDAAWRGDLGQGKALKFQHGVAAKGNPGVAGVIVEAEGALGYMGSEYASALGMKSALLQNSSGLFVAADNSTISAAADVDMPADTRVTITNSQNPSAYPICTFTWLIAYREQGYNNRDMESARSLAQLFLYIISPEGQQMARRTHYASLPEQAIDVVREVVLSMTYKGVAVCGAEAQSGDLGELSGGGTGEADARESDKMR